MRIIGVSEEWPKLQQQEFTTFRFPRKDKDWQVGEHVQIVLHPRSKDRKVLGTARILSVEPRRVGESEFLTKDIPVITTDEALADGFTSWYKMMSWMMKVYGNDRISTEPMNKLTLKWTMRS